MRTMHVVWRSQFVLILLLALPIAVGAQTGKTYTATDPRPVWKLITMLEQEYGWQITYEDPPFESSDDLVDVTETAIKAQAPQTRTLIPRAHTLTFDLVAEPGGSPDRRKCIDRMVDASSASRLSGDFVAIHRGDVSHVIAGSVRKHDGSVAVRKSILDSHISFPAKDRSVGEALALILQLAGQDSATQISLGNVPSNLLDHHTDIGAADIEARDALMLLVGALNAEAISYGLSPIRMTWALLYQADQQMYYFNMHGVAARPQSSPFFTKAR